MYAYVHHVKQARTGYEGLNAFLFATRSVSAAPLRKHVEITPPVNNSVESYLEVEFSKGTTLADIEALLLALSMSASTKSDGTTTLEQQGIGRAEFMILPRFAATRQQEFNRLKECLLHLPIP